jgi:hypothetical protein
MWAGGFSPEIGQSRTSKHSPWLKTKPKRCGGLVAEGPGGVFVFGTYEEDGPVTWEALTFPSDETANGEPYLNLRRSCVLRVHVESGQEEDTSREVGRKQGEPEPRPTDVRESEGRIGAVKMGNGWHRTHRSKGAQL